MEENTINNNTESPPEINAGKNNSQVIAGAIIVAGILIAGAVLLKGSTGGGNIGMDEIANNSIATELAPITPEEHIVGSPEAKIVIVEYSDLECPFCKVFHNTMHAVVAQRGGDVAWVYRHYPIPQLHPRAFFQAEATECAWEQGGNDAFWQYTDRLFEVTPSNNGLADSELPKIAEYIGINVESFNDCLASGKFEEKINAHINDGSKAGTRGTPFSIVLSKENISNKVKREISTAVNTPGREPAVSFSSTHKNALTLNGALPLEMVNKIVDILLK